MPDNVFVIPGHPIAGTESSGPDAGFAELQIPIPWWDNRTLRFTFPPR